VGEAVQNDVMVGEAMQSDVIVGEAVHDDVIEDVICCDCAGIQLVRDITSSSAQAWCSLDLAPGGRLLNFMALLCESNPDMRSELPSALDHIKTSTSPLGVPVLGITAIVQSLQLPGCGALRGKGIGRRDQPLAEVWGFLGNPQMERERRSLFAFSFSTRAYRETIELPSW
jgi:hypothetical protein